MPPLLLLTLLFFYGLAYAESNLPSKTLSKAETKLHSSSNQNMEDSKSRKVITNELPAVADASNSPDIQLEAPDKTVEISDYLSSEWWLVYITLTLAIFTAKLYYATVNLGKEARVTSDRQADEMKKSLAVSQESADAAKRTVETMESTAERQLRAYICATFEEPIKPDINNVFSATIAIKNYGQTPAYEVQHFAKIDVKDFPLNKEELDEPDYTDASKLPLAPSSEPIRKSLKLLKQLSSVENAAIVAKEKAIFVWGEIVYVDIFKIKRRTKFCLYTTGSKFTEDMPAYHHYGNDAD